MICMSVIWYMEMYHKGHSFSLCDSLRRGAFMHYTNTHQHTDNTASSLHEHCRRLSPFSSERSSVCLLNSYLKVDVLCTYFLRIGEFGHCLLRKSLQMWRKKTLWKWNVEQQFIFASDIKGIKHLKPLFTYLPPCHFLYLCFQDKNAWTLIML